jgi:GntR family transcriptional repressor for pyruvate dehydrogenase complex
MQFSSIKRGQSLSDSVVSKLTEAILSGKLQRGQTLPSERDLCRQFEVSRTVIREAIRSLSAKGLATVSSGRGVIVTRPDASVVAEAITMLVSGSDGLDYRCVHEVRIAIEVQVAGLAAERPTASDIDDLREACEAFEAAVKRKDFAGAVHSDYGFHRRLVVASKNILLVALVDSMADLLKKIRVERMSHPGVAERAVKFHWKILRAIEARDGEGAREAMRQHLEDALATWTKTGDV